MLRCSLLERLRRARHAYACSSLPWHALDESIPKPCIGSQYQGQESKFSMLTRYACRRARFLTYTMSRSLRTAKYAGLDLRMKIRFRLSWSVPWYLLVIVGFHLLHYPSLFTNGGRYLVHILRESQTLACEVGTCHTSIHKRCAHHGFNKSELPRRLKSSRIEHLKISSASAVNEA